MTYDMSWSFAKFEEMEPDTDKVTYRGSSQTKKNRSTRGEEGRKKSLNIIK